MFQHLLLLILQENSPSRISPTLSAYNWVLVFMWHSEKSVKLYNLVSQLHAQNGQYSTAHSRHTSYSMTVTPRSKLTSLLPGASSNSYMFYAEREDKSHCTHTHAHTQNQPNKKKNLYKQPVPFTQLEVKNKQNKIQKISQLQGLMLLSQHLGG